MESIGLASLIKFGRSFFEKKNPSETMQSINERTDNDQNAFDF